MSEIYFKNSYLSISDVISKSQHDDSKTITLIRFNFNMMFEAKE